MHLKKLLEAASHQHEDSNDHSGENDADQALGQHVQRDRHRESPANPARGIFLFVSDEEKIQTQREPHGHDHVRNQKSRVDVNSRGGDQNQSRIKSTFLSEVASAKKKNAPRQAKYRQRQGQASLPFPDSE